MSKVHSQLINRQSLFKFFKFDSFAKRTSTPLT